MALGAFRLPGPEEPEPDPIYKIWLPETPWRPMPHGVPQLDHWTCRICGAKGCPVPGYDQIDGGVEHVRTEHADFLTAQVAEQEAMSTEPEPEETPVEPIDPMAAAEALNAGVRQLSDLLLGAVRTLEAEGWTPAQARALVLKTYLGTVPE